MPRPWLLVDSVDSGEGRLELRRRDERDYMISVAGRVLMSSTLNRSEVAVAELSCARIADRKKARVLVGGLGLGFTLRAALNVLPTRAEVVVAELNDAVVRWCRGPLAALTDAAVDDPRVQVRTADVTSLIREAAAGHARAYDAIVLDLYEGPGAVPRGRPDPLYGKAILAHTAQALTPGGVYAVWAENPDPPFERRLQAAGFRAELVRQKGGGPRHAVYLATLRSRTSR